MTHHRDVSMLFYLGALYDGVLGFLFLFLPQTTFGWVGEAPIEHFGYVKFPGALLLVFAWMFWNTARHPVANRMLIPYMTAFKLAYAVIVIGYWMSGDVPAIWKPFAIVDLVFAGCFVWAYSRLRGPQPR